MVVLPPRISLLDLGGPVEVLRRANFEQNAIYFNVRYVGATRSVSSSIGIDVHRVEPLPSSLPNDAIVHRRRQCRPRIRVGPPDRLRSRRPGRGRHRSLASNSAFVPPIRSSQSAPVRCSSAVPGLLDGRRCTTHHLDCPRLARLAPRAKVLEDRLFVQDDNIYTSAGATAGVDLMLFFVSHLVGPARTAAIARHLVVYLRRTGLRPASLSVAARDATTFTLPCIACRTPSPKIPRKPWTRTQLARVAGASGRHLSRLFHQQVGMPLVDYRNRLRVAVARELVLQSELDMENIAERSGFSSTRQLRRAWGRVYSSSPSEARTAASRLASASAA